MKSCVLFLASLLVAILASAQSARPISPPNPESAFPDFVPNSSTVIPLDRFPAEGKAFVSHGNQSILASSKQSPAGVTYRQVEAAEQEVTGARNAVVSGLQKAMPSANLLKVRAAQLSGANFEELSLIGSKADSPVGQQGMSRLIRVFSNEKRLLYVREWELSAEGGAVIQIAEYVNCLVNGVPAVLVVRTHPKAGAYWTLNWTTGSKDYELGAMETVLSPRTADELMAIASSIR